MENSRLPQFKKSPPTKGGKVRKVEVAGYRSANDRILNIINAGKKLVSSEEQYDYNNGEVEEDTAVPRVRNKNYDDIDLQYESERLKANLKITEQKFSEKQKELELQKQKAEEIKKVD